MLGTCRRLVAVTASCAAAITVLSACESDPVRPDPVVDPSIGGCVFQPSAPIVVNNPNYRPIPADILPPTEVEIVALGSFLKKLSDSNESSKAMAALGSGDPFSFQRLGAVMGDVQSILAGLHAVESLELLGEIPGVSIEFQGWMEGQLLIMSECPPLRFEERGGKDAYERTRDLVQKYRQTLDPYIFNSAPRQDFSKPDEFNGERETAR